MKFSTLALFLCFVVSANAQSDSLNLAIGTWRSHLPYKYAVSVTQSQDYIFYATPWAILRLDKEDRAQRRITKVEGLSRAGMERLAYNEGNDVLVVVYDNSLIDLVSEAGIFTLPDIKNFSGILAEKRVLDIDINGEKTALIVGNFGLTELDLTDRIFNFTTFTGNEVRNVEVFDEQIFLATDEGIYFSPTSNPVIEDFTTWELFTDNGAFPEDYTANALAVWRNTLYFEAEGNLFRFDGTTTDLVLELDDGQFAAYLTAEGERLILGIACEDYDDCQAQAYYFSDDTDFEISGWGCVSRPYNAIEDENGRVWLADQFQDFRISRSTDESCERLTFNSPPAHNVAEIDIYEDEVWVAGGGTTTNTIQALFRDDGLFVLKEGEWTIYNTSTVPDFTGPEGKIRDIWKVDINPTDGTIYAGTALEGFLEFNRENEAFTIYNEFNSALTTPTNDPGRSRVGDVFYDDESGNLWVTNYLAPIPLHVRLPDGTWRSFTPPNGERQMLDIVKDRNGYIWMITANTSAGVVVLDPGDVAMMGDERWRTIQQSGNGEDPKGLPSNRTFSIATDRDGGVWVGTEKGVVVFECGTSAFDAELCTGLKPIVEQDGIPGFLLETTAIRDIEIDGGNRKWFGTDAGIFVQSANGREQIANFNEDNSPLFDNVITDLAIQPTTGEVFVGTNRGLQSFIGEAVQGQLFNSANVTAFPNPVRPEYDGPIAIKGLAQDANVKVTDVSGQLVYEGEALGGQAIWDGRDYTGRRVNSGVYLVYATNTNRRDKAEAVVTKILVLN